MSHQLFTLPPIIAKDKVVKRDAGIPDLSTLKPTQAKVVNGILQTLSNTVGGCMLLLEGVAGSGKTFCTSRIIEQLLHLHFEKRIAFTALTNRAVKVSFMSTEFYHPALEFATIHKMLALKEVILPDGTIDFYPDKFILPAIKDYKYVFIDESSQLGAKIWGYLLEWIDKGLKVIFIADRFQTPPVKESLSLIFKPEVQKRHNMQIFKLTEIVRQAADNPIISVATFVRENADRHISLGTAFDYDNLLWQKDKGVSFYKSNRQDDRSAFDDLLRHIFCSNNFKTDTNFAKVICWRNKVVRGLNTGIRKMIYGTKMLRRIEPGEKIVSRAPIWDLDYDTIIVNNGEQMEVIDFEKQTENINDGYYQLAYYDTKVKYYDIRGNEVIKRINVPTDKGTKVFNEVSATLAAAAKTYTKGSFQASNAWKDFYAFQKSFANISHNYAGNVHTAQGLSITNTVLMSNDIICNPKIAERNKILYTGVTRAVERLFII